MFMKRVRSMSFVLLTLFGCGVLALPYLASGIGQAQATVDDPPRRLRWEYKTLTADEIRALAPVTDPQGTVYLSVDERFSIGLATLGADGWELAICNTEQRVHDLVLPTLPELRLDPQIVVYNTFIFKRSR